MASRKGNLRMRTLPAHLRVRPVLPAAVAAVALLAAGCGGGSGKPGTGSGPAGLTVQKMDSFAACMRGHGMPNFYVSRPSPGSNGDENTIGGFQIPGNPQSVQFQSGMKACQRILGLHSPPQAVQQQQLEQARKQAACMRSHGYPGVPDPSLAPNGAIVDPGPPAGVDTNSPQYLKAEKACGM